MQFCGAPYASGLSPLIHKTERPKNLLRGCSRHPQQRPRDTGQGPENSLGEETGLVGEASAMKRKTNFDRYLEEQLKDEGFAERFKKAWDVALELAALRKESCLSQKELAKRVGTTQQQISRLESTSYEGHSLSMLRRVAEALGATIHIELLRGKQKKSMGVAEDNPHCGGMK